MQRSRIIPGKWYQTLHGAALCVKVFKAGRVQMSRRTGKGAMTACYVSQSDIEHELAGSPDEVVCETPAESEPGESPETIKGLQLEISIAKKLLFAHRVALQASLPYLEQTTMIRASAELIQDVKELLAKTEG